MLSQDTINEAQECETIEQTMENKAFWRPIGASWRHLGGSWRRLGGSWRRLGRSSGRLEGVLEAMLSQDEPR